MQNYIYSAYESRFMMQQCSMCVTWNENDVYTVYEYWCPVPAWCMCVI